MKVTVCFGPTRIVVPCGDGQFTVRDLIAKAVARYKKATEKGSSNWVMVHKLRQLDGGILDPDDRLHDVADDREQIIAVYDEERPDGNSASDRSASPEIFMDVDHKFEPFSRNGIDITGDELSLTPPLHVRRGSEPALNNLSPIQPCHSDGGPFNAKRWSAAPVIEDDMPPTSTPSKDQQVLVCPRLEEASFEDYLGERGEGSGEEKLPSSASPQHSPPAPPSRFSRDGNRCSVQILSDNPASCRWADAADRAMESGAALQATQWAEGPRREPLGGTDTPHHSREHSLEKGSLSHTMLVRLPRDTSCPLGIHVIPSPDTAGRDQGLLVEGIEKGGRIAANGCVRIRDIITEINGVSLAVVSFHQAQEIFKDAMKDDELRLLLVRKEERSFADRFIQMKERPMGVGAKVATVSTTRKTAVSLLPPPPSATPPLPPTTAALTLSSRTQAAILQSNTRRIGKRLSIKLVKGANGLGFSITTRDNPAGGEAPIYIKNILPKGAAIEEGSLRIGDRLLEVNGVEVTGCSQTEVATLLRQISVGGSAALVVSRQEKLTEKQTTTTNPSSQEEEDRPVSPKLPREMPSERVAEDSLLLPWKQREILTFEIPVHDSERAGLGVGVKGKTSSGPHGNVDLGIFVKNVIHGGAASRDGRLRTNDQLVNINGLSLIGQSNSVAMRTLKTTMYHESAVPGKITLTVARRVDGATFSKRDSAMERSVDVTSPMGGDFHTNNPVIQRLTGAPSNSVALRNESYYKATHDTWVASSPTRSSSTPLTPPERERSSKVAPFASPTVHLPSQDTVIIQDEYDTKNNKSSNRRPSDQVDQQSQSSDAYVSQTSLEDCAAFTRDQFGRQSMSEKRHATLDAKSTDTYQRNKKAREEREKVRQEMTAEEDAKQNALRNRSLLREDSASKGIPSRTHSEDLVSRSDAAFAFQPQTNFNWGPSRGGVKSPKEIGPGLGMRKSSSLESLQTMVQELALEEDVAMRAGSGRAPRGRGCNESFRAAVDRSYDAPAGAVITNPNAQMETLAEEESESSGSGFGRGNSRQSSLGSAADDKHRKASRKRQGILRGLGSMFRFGRHRRGLESGPINTTEECDERVPSTGTEVDVRRRPISSDEMSPLDQELRRQVETGSHTPILMDGSFGDDDGVSRSERMQQLRAEHQRRHVERNGFYPTDHKQRYENTAKKRMDTMPSEPKEELRQIRAEGNPRPSSAFHDPNKYSHYVNYEQIQMHLRKNKEQERLAKLASQQYQDFREKQTSREQREYQSQRSARENCLRQRPVSNYFEYECVQAVMTRPQDASQHTASLPRRGHRQQQKSNPPQKQPPPPPPQAPFRPARNQHPQAQKQFSDLSTPHSNEKKQQQTQNINGSQRSYSSQGSGRMPSPPPQSWSAVREGMYAAAGFRPASQYNPPFHMKPFNQNGNNVVPLTVPGSKV